MGGAVGTDSTEVAVPVLSEVRRTMFWKKTLKLGPSIMVNRFSSFSNYNPIETCSWGLPVTFSTLKEVPYAVFAAQCYTYAQSMLSCGCQSVTFVCVKTLSRITGRAAVPPEVSQTFPPHEKNSPPLKFMLAAGLTPGTHKRATRGIIFFINSE